MPEIMSAINAYVLAELAKIQETPSGTRLPSGHDFPGTTFPAAISEDAFPGDSQEELMCRHDVSPLIARRYLTGSYWAEFNFSYYAKSAQVVLARQWLEAIEEILFLDNFTNLLGLSQGRLETVARPTFISRDESGANIYTSSYQLVYFEEV
jgi:hypothetical protein